MWLADFCRPESERRGKYQGEAFDADKFFGWYDTHGPADHRIDVTEFGWYLADCASSAGTFLLIPDAGSRVDIGDVVRIGKTEINFFVQVEQEPAA